MNISYIKTCNILSLSGGGVFGAFEAGVLSNLTEKNHTWNLITGVSAGGINAGYISTIESGKEKYNVNLFKELWTSMKNEDIYSHSFFLNGLSYYDSLPLKKTFDKIFRDLNPIRPVKISATSLKKGSSKVFTDEDIERYGFTNILMSSTAIPVLLPPYEFGGDIYVDGGITSNLLLNEGIEFCLQNYPDENIYVDVIVCGQKLGVDDDVSMHFKVIFNRLISVIAEQLEYSELLHSIVEENIYVTVYEEKIPQSYDLLDFTVTETLWSMGYDFSNVHQYWINGTNVS